MKWTAIQIDQRRNNKSETKHKIYEFLSNKKKHKTNEFLNKKKKHKINEFLRKKNKTQNVWLFEQEKKTQNVWIYEQEKEQKVNDFLRKKRSTKLMRFWAEFAFVSVECSTDWKKLHRLSERLASLGIMGGLIESSP